MTEKPILFSAPMIRAILDGTKTVTRRIVRTDLRVRLDRAVDSDDLIPGMPGVTAKPGRHRARLNAGGAVTLAELDLGVKPGEFHFVCPYATGRTRLADFPSPPGWRTAWEILPDPEQRLWVKETHAQFAVGNRTGSSPQCVAYRATCDDDGGFDYVNNGDEVMHLKVTRWTPAIHMPRWASRITLEVVSVRVERLHEITERDAKAEGVRPFLERYSSFAADQRIDGERDSLGRRCLLERHLALNVRKLDARPDDGDRVDEKPYRTSFVCLWDEINGDRALFSSNPFVWRVEFRRVAERAA